MIVIICISFALLCAVIHIWISAIDDEHNFDNDDSCYNCPHGACMDAPDAKCQKWRKDNEDKNKQ